MSKKTLTNEQIEFIMGNNFRLYPEEIAETLGLKPQQIRWFYHKNRMDYKRKYKTGGELTDRELEIYNQLLTHKSLQEIADELFLSRATINTYNGIILRKKLVSSRIELMSERIKELEDEIARTQQVLNSYYAGE